MQIITREDAKSASLLHYYTGIACRNGHLSQRRVSDSRCSNCAADNCAIQRKKDPESLAAKHREYYLNNSEAKKLRQREYHKNNKAEISKTKRAYEKKHAASIASKSKLYREQNSEVLAKKRSAQQKNNRSAGNARGAKYKASQLRATPVWANQGAIREIYKLASLAGMHVDHIFPLQGKLVCGLHVENNLQLLPPVENHRKNNRFNPDDHEIKTVNSQH